MDRRSDGRGDVLMKVPRYLPTGEVRTYRTADGRTAHRPVMAPNPAWRAPSDTTVTTLVMAYDRDKRTCRRCERRVHWFVAPEHRMAPALDDDGRLVHLGCLALPA